MDETFLSFVEMMNGEIRALVPFTAGFEVMVGIAPIAPDHTVVCGYSRAEPRRRRMHSRFRYFLGVPEIRLASNHRGRVFKGRKIRDKCG